VIPQTRQNLVLLEATQRKAVRKKNGVFKQVLENVARVRCGCGNEFVITLSRWRNGQVDKCRRCALRAAKGWGIGVFGDGKRLRAK
jgi:hypothetical protein